MGLTLAEKEHWKERISRRIDQRIEMLVAKEDPMLIQRVGEAATARAYESLGIAAQQKELRAAKKQIEELEKREKRLFAEQRAQINGTSVEQELEDGGYYRDHDQEVDKAVEARAKVHECEILTDSELGRQVVALRREKDNLLDTVWLATSPSQIKELWEQVNSLLELKPTALEQKALEIQPLEDKE